MRAGWKLFLLLGLLGGCEKRVEVVVPEEAVVLEADWVSLVPEEGDGKWTALSFGGEGSSEWTDGVLALGEGIDLTGMRWGGALPQTPYEIELEARKTRGSDFFCGLTVPVRGGTPPVPLIVGGWGGDLVGISSINGLDASENQTTTWHKFEMERWYRVRLVVEMNRLAIWLGDEKVADVDTTDRDLGMRLGAIEDCVPLGLASYQTDAEIRGIRWRTLP